MTIYKVTENKGYDSKEMFFETEECANKYMKRESQYHINHDNIDDLYVSCDAPRYLSIRFGDHTSEHSGLYMTFEIDEVIVY